MTTPPPHAATIGTFDGVHLGHARLLEAARRLAGPSGRVTVLAFDPHPRSVIATAPPRLTTWNTRDRLLRERGANEVVRLEPTEALLSLDPEAFVRTRILPLGVTDIIEGPDFRFGRKRAGDTGVLAALGEAFGFRVHPEPPVIAHLTDRADAPISSTTIRWLIAHGRVRDAATLLGRPYTLEGTVVRGERLGRTIGVPTANLDCDNQPPQPGVYAAHATLPDGRAYPAALNIGTRPTVGGTALRVEAHLINAPITNGTTIDGLEEYGWRLDLHCLARIRDEVRFPSINELKAQLARDIARVRETTHAGSHT